MNRQMERMIGREIVKKTEHQADGHTDEQKDKMVRQMDRW